MIVKLTQFVDKTFFFFLPHGHPWDYVRHIALSFGGVIAIFFVLKLIGVNWKASLAVATIIMLGLEIIKEIGDSNLGKTDMAWDMAANIIGLFTAVLVVSIYEIKT